jgi:transcriptional regulator with XRE-family HTH domain
MARKNQAIPTQSMTPSHSPVARTLGRKLRILRAKTGQTQDAVARSLNSDRSFISRLERGAVMPRLSTLLRLANYYGVDVSTLLSDRSTSTREKDG